MQQNLVRKYRAIQHDFSTAMEYADVDSNTKKEVEENLCEKYFLSRRTVLKVLKKDLQQVVIKSVNPNQIQMFN